MRSYSCIFDDALGDGLEVGQHAAEPTLVDVRHAALLGVAAHGILGLLLGADEQHRAALGGQVADEVVGGLDAGQRLLEVDDVDAVALAEDESLHLRVPTAGLVPEVDTGFEHLSHGDDGHDGYSSLCGWRADAPGAEATAGRSGTIDSGTVGVDGRFGHVIGAGPHGHPLRVHGGAHHGRWRRPARRRPVDGHEPRSIPQHAEERGRIDVSIAWRRPKKKCSVVVPTTSPGSHTPAPARSSGAETAVRGGATVGLRDHEVAHAGDDTAERHDACGAATTGEPGGGWYSNPRLPGQNAHAGARNGSDDRRIDRRLVARACASKTSDGDQRAITIATSGRLEC